MQQFERLRSPREVDQAIAEACLDEAMRIGGLCADPRTAFYAGGQLALRCLLGCVLPASLLVTEPSGQHPRRLRTEFRGGRVYGEKVFALAHAGVWFVVAKVAEQEGVVDLRLYEVDPTADGVQRSSLELPFDLGGVYVSAKLEGVAAKEVGQDAWATVVRPFRLLEDAFVLTAVGAWLREVGGAPGLASSMDALASMDLARIEAVDQVVALGHAADAIEAAWSVSTHPSAQRDWPLHRVGRKARMIRVQRAMEER